MIKQKLGLILPLIIAFLMHGQSCHTEAQETVTYEFTGFESPVWSPDSKRFIFSGVKDKNADLYVMNRDGSSLKRLTEHPARDTYPTWSPDGKKIAFASYRSDGKTSQIYVMNSDGSNIVQITEGEDKNSYPSWSPDRKKIVYMSKPGEGKWHIYLMNADGSNRKKLTEGEVSDFNPVFSPDGKKILFESDRDEGNLDEIYVMNADGSSQTRLTYNNKTEENDIFPAWLAGGKQISFTTIKDRKANVYRMNADGTEQTLLFKDATFANWSPDGKKVIYYSLGGGKPSYLFLANADGSNLKQITK